MKPIPDKKNEVQLRKEFKKLEFYEALNLMSNNKNVMKTQDQLNDIKNQCQDIIKGDENFQKSNNAETDNDNARLEMVTLGEVIADRIISICNDSLFRSKLTESIYSDSALTKIKTHKDPINETNFRDSIFTNTPLKDLEDSISIKTKNSDRPIPINMTGESSCIQKESSVPQRPVNKHHLVDIHGLAVFLRDATRCLSCRSSGTLYITGSVAHSPQIESHPVMTKFTITCQKCRFLTQQELSRPNSFISPLTSNSLSNSNESSLKRLKTISDGIQGNNLPSSPKMPIYTNVHAVNSVSSPIPSMNSILGSPELRSSPNSNLMPDNYQQETSNNSLLTPSQSPQSCFSPMSYFLNSWKNGFDKPMTTVHWMPPNSSIEGK